MTQVMQRWLDLGIDGFRLDAIPYLCERDGTSNESLPETHAIIKKIRAELDAHGPGKVLLAEANQWPEDVSAYFGEGDECHMAYHFPLMPRIYMAIAQEDRFPFFVRPQTFRRTASGRCSYAIMTNSPWKW
jgi:maltose alpha-D-glucosyltransferase/alpha-amylase